MFARAERPLLAVSLPQLTAAIFIMAILSANALLCSISLFHLTVAYYLLTAPLEVADSSLVAVLGVAMDIPFPGPSFSTPSPALAFAALVLALSAISDLSACTLSEEVASHYWCSQAPVRLVFLFGITGYAMYFKPGGAMALQKVAKGGLSNTVCNSLVFTWGFAEMLMWFWIFVKLREERAELMRKKEEKRRLQEERMM